MKIIYVADTIPSPNRNAEAMVNWTILNELNSMGHQVFGGFVISKYDNEILSDEAKKKIIIELETKNIVTRFFERNNSNGLKNQKNFFAKLKIIRSTFYPKLEEFYGHMPNEIFQFINDINPDVVCVSDANCVYGLKELTRYPKLAIPPDPLHMTMRISSSYRNKFLSISEKLTFSYLRQRIKQFFISIFFPRELVNILSKYNSVLAYGIQHTNWYKSKGLNCTYIPPLVIDCDSKYVKRIKQNKFKILMYGTLASTASGMGLDYLSNKILPKLEKKLTNKFEVHIAGSGQIPNKEVLTKLKKNKSVIFRGYIQDLGKEIINSDIVLVPIPYKVGVRTRIIEAFSYGACVIAHSSARDGIPELIDRKNILMSDNSDGIIKSIIKVFKDKSYKELIGKNALEAYEIELSSMIICKKIEQQLLRIQNGK